VLLIVLATVYQVVDNLTERNRTKVTIIVVVGEMCEEKGY
jgi:hypothetical protein